MLGGCTQAMAGKRAGKTGDSGDATGTVVRRLYHSGRGFVVCLPVAWVRQVEGEGARFVQMRVRTGGVIEIKILRPVADAGSSDGS